MVRHVVATTLLAASVLAAVGAALPARAMPAHAIAMHGQPAMPPEMVEPAYANPRAPKGGRLVQGMLGTFDSLNPFIVLGLSATGIRGYVVESLLTRGLDEPFTLYGLLAQSVETDDERTFVTFNLDPRATFSDGRPVTPEDVVFSFRLLRDKGRPNHRTYYRKVKAVAITGARSVRFDLTGADDRELPLILGLMPVLPRHAVDPDTFERTSLAPPLGSGPYLVTEVRPGESLVLRRDPDYWGRDLAITRGLNNFDEVRFDYYRDANTHFEAFKRGLYDVRVETDPGRWASGYDFPAVRDGHVVRATVADGLPKPVTGLVFNLRRPVFSDPRVREALIELFDFEWLNANYYFGAYRRTGSFFEGSELSALGRPASDAERQLLAPFAAAIRPDVMDGSYRPPVTDGSGRDRDRLRHALETLAAAGYRLDGGVLRGADGTPFAFEILVGTKDQERLALAYARMVRRAGISAEVRLVDNVQYDRRLQTYDYDMMPFTWTQSLSPGNEQAFYFGSTAADALGTRNYMGAKNPAVDAMIEAMLAARDRASFVSAVHALDRCLISGLYMIPLFHLPEQRIARWKYIGWPEHSSLNGPLPESWWRVAP
ncbi:extracellular solute-binding protein [Blastochloris viridis]|nr:extracellular solute-binding protein [Blastochloris viridis]ALK09283.1 Oligopeptide-binding protein AppA precursor [Blastochloris viridis]CUU41946.1 Oligopeptide-binding protein AppA precursor [Blastochloris viridis]